MKKIFFIARNELYSLYFSPIAWLLMALFLFLTSVDYMGVLEMAVGGYERGGWSRLLTNNITDLIISNAIFGYFPKIISGMYMILPLITMGLISRETSSGTIKMLYSSPIRIRELVLGKFLAMISFIFALLLLVALTLISVVHNITAPDYPHIWAAMFALFIVLCTYSAIGLFVSSLTQYQIVAAIITLAFFGLLARVGGLWQEIDTLRNITFYLNLSGKSGALLSGLLNLRDISYFLIIITSFILFTIIKIKSATESVSVLKKTLRYVAVIVCAVVFGYITNKPEINVYADMTRDQLYTVTPPTQAMIKKMNEGPIEVTLYTNLFSDFGRGWPREQRNVEFSIWEPYIRFKPDLHVNFAYYYATDTGSWRYKAYPGKSLKEIAETELKSYNMTLDKFLSPEEVSKQVNVEEEEYRNFFEVKYKGKKVILRTFDDMMYWPGEDEIVAAMHRLIDTVPVIGFLTGDIERGPFSQRPRDYKGLVSQRGNRISLINQGYDVDTFNLNGKDIPAGLAGVVISDPRVALSKEAQDKISKYINDGGNLFLVTEPDRREVMKPLLDTLGLSLRSGLLMEPDPRFSSDHIFTYLTEPAINLSPQLAKDIEQQRKYLSEKLFRVALGGSSVIEYKEKNGFKVTPMLTTDSALIWNRTAPVTADSLNLKVSRRADDENGSFVTGVKLTRNVGGREQRIYVVSDADFLTGDLMKPEEPYGKYNWNLGFYSLSSFSYGKFPANTMRPRTDDSVDIKVADIGFQRVIYYYILPILLGVIGSIVLIRRKRK